MTRLGGLARANVLARANALANALTLAHDLAHDLDHACGLDHVEILAGTLARANALAGALTNASALNRDHTLDLTRALNHSRDLTRDLAGTLSEASAIASDLEDAGAGDLNRVFAHAALVRAHSHALALVRDLVDLDPAAHWARAVVAGSGQSMPGRVSCGLVALAVRLLPVAQRPRYREEFSVELVELRRRARLGYSLRVLARGWELRRALVEAVCTPDGATARRAER